jgi:hypothetical protein
VASGDSAIAELKLLSIAQLVQPEIALDSEEPSSQIAIFLNRLAASIART